MEQSKPPSVELAEKNVANNQDYVEVMIGYWTRRRDDLVTGLERADAELIRFTEMKDVKAEEV